MNEETVLYVAQRIEEAVDSKIESLDTLEDDEIAEIRNRRVNQLRSMQKHRAEWLVRGHGKYNEIECSADFFRVCKGSERVVVHFYRASTERCAIMHAHLEKIATEHFETYFGKVNVERVVGLAEHFNVVLLPTIMLIERGKSFNSLIGFDELGGGDDFSTDQLLQYLAHNGVVNKHGMFASDQSKED